MSRLNERNTETIVRKHFDADTSVEELTIDEQGSSDPTIARLLGRASKRGPGLGRPEFIVRTPMFHDLVVIVECKADVKMHASPNLDQPGGFAADGALHYARHLSKRFDVIAIGVSGENERTMRISTFGWFRGQARFVALEDAHGAVEDLRDFADYEILRRFNPGVRERNRSELMAFSRELHNYLRDYAKLAEAEKPLVVGAAMIALQDKVFAASYNKASPDEAPLVLLQGLERQFKRAQIPAAKQKLVLQPFGFIENHPVLNRVPTGEHSSPLQKIIADVDERVQPFLSDNPDVDVLGQFYGEFLRYSGGDGKGLGIVLTPRHITDLFALVAEVGPNDTVLDICAGTAGFLISSMAEMDKAAGSDQAMRKRIRERGLVGVEQRPDMFALAVANMLLRGDGKANLYQADCFDQGVAKAMTSPHSKRHERPNIGLINPPYAQKGEGLNELNFVKAMLDYLAPGGTGVAILPMRCAIGKSLFKRRLMDGHTLVAVMSLPNDLFQGVGVVPCMMVWKAHSPHSSSEHGTWFGYWKDDGFIKTKADGRVDRKGVWPSIREKWLTAFRLRQDVPGSSVIRAVGPDDEWCAEAYMETDYSTLSRDDFAEVVRSHSLYLVDLAARQGM